MKFFIVDDDQEMIDLMTALLEAEGHAVFSSIAGDFAISGIVSRLPDCVLTDLMMAGMDGLQLCDEIRRRQELNKTKIIMISAREADLWGPKADQRGANGYIQKPLNVETFVGQVMEILEAEGGA